MEDMYSPADCQYGHLNSNLCRKVLSMYTARLWLKALALDFATLTHSMNL